MLPKSNITKAETVLIIYKLNYCVRFLNDLIQTAVCIYIIQTNDTFLHTIRYSTD